MKKHIHNTDQAYIKAACEQREHAYFMSVSEGASWPAWLKSRRAGIRTVSQQASLCPSRQGSTAAPWARMSAQGREGTAPIWGFGCSFSHTADNINNTLDGLYTETAPAADMASHTLTAHECWTLGICLVLCFPTTHLTQMMVRVVP